MKKYKDIIRNLLISFFLILFFYWFIGFQVIGNDKFSAIKDSIPNYFNWKYIIKKHFFFKDDTKNKILLKSDGSRIFELSEENSIYIYTRSKSKQKLEIEGILKDRKINCLNTSFIKDKVIEINKFSPDCKNAIYYIGIIESKLMKNIILILAFNKKNNNKNLLIFPTTSFYNYSSNIFNLNVYSTKNSQYISILSEILQILQLITFIKLENQFIT